MSYNVKSEKTRENSDFRTFEDLEVYQAAREFRRQMYAAARQLPDFEKYALGDQIRRAALSLTNNIAEGHGRFYFADQVKFFLTSRGSLQELIDDLNTCEDEHYLESSIIGALKEQAWGVLRGLNGYLRYLRDRKQVDRSKVREDSDAYSTEDDEALTAINEALASAPPI